MDIKKVNAAVKIAIAMTRTKNIWKYKKLLSDLGRLKNNMTSEELTEYQKRVN